MPTLSRTVVAAVAGCLFAAGCGQPPGSARPGKPVPLAVADPTTAPDAGTDAAGFANEFLAAVHAGTARPDQLTPAFKTIIAEPVFPSDKEKGYSDAAAADWLAGFKGKLGTPRLAPAGGGDATLFTGPASADGPRHVALRVVKADGGWRADALAVAGGGPFTVTLPGGDGTYPAFAAVLFLNAVLGRDDRLAEGLMTPTLKAALAPPLGADPRGYNRTLLAQRTNDLRGAATGFAVESAAGPTVRLSLLGPNGATKPLTLTLARGDKPWDWRVDAIQPE